MKFLYCVTPSNTKANSRKHHKNSRKKRRNSRSSYVSPRRKHSHQTDNSLSTIRPLNNNRNAFYHPMNDYNALDMNAMNYVEMGVPPTIFEHQIYTNNQNSYQKSHSNVNQLLKMNAKVYPSTGGGSYQSIANHNVVRGNAFYSGVDKKRRKRVSEKFCLIYPISMHR